VNYYATPSESLAMGWQCKMYANDSSSGSDSNKTNFTIASLIAIVLNVTTVDFGSLSPNANNTADVPFNVTNFGNVIIDAKFAADNLTSGANPNINASNLWYNISFGTSGLFKKLQNSTSGPSGVDNIADYNLNVSYAGASGANGNESNKTQYFRIHIDSGQPSGTYTGTLYVTGTANA
jgi:spore coat protein U-like protein